MRYLKVNNNTFLYIIIITSICFLIGTFIVKYFNLDEYYKKLIIKFKKMYNKEGLENNEDDEEDENEDEDEDEDEDESQTTGITKKPSLEEIQSQVIHIDKANALKKKHKDAIDSVLKQVHNGNNGNNENTN